MWFACHPIHGATPTNNLTPLQPPPAIPPPPLPKGHTELAALEPGMREMQHHLRLSRRAFAQQARIAEAKRMQLELLLSTGQVTVRALCGCSFLRG